MKRLLFLAAFVLSATALSAQNCIVVNSEKIFKSIDAYNTAIRTLDNMAEIYQKQVDEKFEEVENYYNTYMAQKASLPASTRQARENAILRPRTTGQRIPTKPLRAGGLADEKTRGADRAHSETGFRPSSKPTPSGSAPRW